MKEVIILVNEKTWEEFRKSGLLWWINMILHTLGWSIVADIDNNGQISRVYPARVGFRGFTEEANTEGYIKVSQYIQDNASELIDEAKR
ncbi:hypothetical protein [Paenibacillus sp. FSL R5-808]|uniref:hypothetical protein n=1 Tax=unclassified Paenibacillus TaxID=185978 RepID=UPI0003E1B95A|nr:hypothetical protein [Paenibacillus sp. FSL R5-808]ETT32147.1 hypothetical protein C169_24095 [Paenibacillus sp. FSL R5-808]